MNRRHSKLFSSTLSILVLLFSSAASAQENRVLALAERMKAAFLTVEDYTCDVEQVYYDKKEEEDQRFRFKYFFKKGKKIRMDFSYPHTTLTLIYLNRKDYTTVIPLRALPALKFQFSLDSSIVKTPTGQKINQTDMEYFIKFIFRNLAEIKQQKKDFQEDQERVNFWFWARDYLKGKTLEKYRIFLSKENWFPVRIERYTLEG